MLWLSFGRFLLHGQGKPMWPSANAIRMVSSHVWTGLRQQFLPDDRRSEEFQVLPEWSSQDWADSHCVHVQDEVLSRLESQFLDPKV